MSNKLKKVFSKNDKVVEGTIRFKEKTSYDEFKKDLEAVFKEGKTIKFNKEAEMSMHVNSGLSKFPLEKDTAVTNIMVGPCKDRIEVELKDETGIIKFPMLRYFVEGSCIIETTPDFLIETKVRFDEIIQSAKVQITPHLSRAKKVEDVLRDINTIVLFLNKIVIADKVDENTDYKVVIHNLNSIHSLFDKMLFVEKKFGISFDPALIELNDIESQKDLLELCTVIKDKKAIRINKKISDAEIGVGELSSKDEIILNSEILMSFLGENVYMMWGYNVKLFCTNFLVNAIVKSVDTLENGNIKITYGENESKPMYISYKGFITEEEARVEIDKMYDNKEEYISAKTLEQYMQL